MSALTLQDVMDTESRTMFRAAIAWAALAEDLDNAYERLVRGVRLIDRDARGEAALAAARTLRAHSNQISNSFNPARRISMALERHGHAIDQLHAMVLDVSESARRRGWHVSWQTGQITGRSPVARVDDPSWDLAANSLRAEVREILARARRLDDETTTVIRGALPAPLDGVGFGDSLASRIDEESVKRWVNGSPYDVNAWWLSLSPEQQEQVIRDYPKWIGSFDGVPATDRDRANRVNLSNHISALYAREGKLERQIEDAGRLEYAYPSVLLLERDLEQVRREQAGLFSVRQKLADLGPQALLMAIDHTGDGKAIVAMGDPDGAKHVAVFVPGVGTDLRDIGGDMDRVRNLYEWADRKTAVSDDVSVVYWLGYDAPDRVFDVSAATGGASREGGRWFTPFVDGLHATHQPNGGATHVTAVGHSYGSTVIAEAALAGGLRVRDIVTAGSPGMHTDHASNLNIDPKHVWGGLADNDVVGKLPVHGEEPTDRQFGSNRYVVDTSGHSAYWRPSSISLENQAYIVVGQYGRVSLEYGSAPAG
jgi:Alpha/beta hydrolase